MASLNFSTKRLQINKASATMVLPLTIASFITVFSLVATRALLSQRSYQSRVISEKEKAKKQLKENIVEVEKLRAQYKGFADAPTNVLGGDPRGAGEKDGDNARIVLDALPSKYDFPALATSLEKLLTNGGYKIESIAGSDDELNQQTNAFTLQTMGLDGAENDLKLSITANTYYQPSKSLNITTKEVR
jgi:hypothetical protein